VTADADEIERTQTTAATLGGILPNASSLAAIRPAAGLLSDPERTNIPPRLTEALTPYAYTVGGGREPEKSPTGRSAPTR
jgi:hypothetical protein